MAEYAKLDENGRIARVVRTVGDLSPEQMEKEGLSPYLRIASVEYDTTTHKEDGFETVVVDGSVHVRPRVVQKTDVDLYAEAIERRRAMIPSSTERIEVMAAIIDELIAWVDLQAEPGKPHTHSTITGEQRRFIKELLADMGPPILPMRPV